MTQRWSSGSSEGPTVAVIVGCGKDKLNRKAQAQVMYTSTYFAKKRSYAKVVGDEWYILSGKHGLLEPDEVIEPYDEEPPDDWTVDTSSIECDRIIVLAGKRYAFAIDDSRAEFPLQRFDGFHEQQKWLHEQVEEATNV